MNKKTKKLLVTMMIGFLVIATIYNTARTIRFDKRDIGLKLLTIIPVN